MFCSHCGKQLPDDSKFCPECGTQVLGAEQPAPAVDVVSQPCTGDASDQLPQSQQENSTQINANLAEAWSASYQKNKMIGAVTYKRIHTDVSISNSEIRISKKVGRKKPIESNFPYSAIKSILQKSVFDFWDALYCVIFLLIALACCIAGYWGKAIVPIIIAGICFFTGFGQEIVFTMRDHSKVSVPLSSKKDATTLVEKIGQAGGKTLSIKRSQTEPLIICICMAVLVIISAFVAFSMGNCDDTSAAVQTVRSGYLGGYTDVTVEELVAYAFHDWDNADAASIVWDGGITETGEMIVEASCTNKAAETSALQFKMLSDDTFQFSALSDPNVVSTHLEDVMIAINDVYYFYYLDQTGNDSKTVHLMNQYPMAAILCGASADYEGDRTNLYQDAFDLDLPYTIAEYYGWDGSTEDAVTDSTSVYPAEPTPKNGETVTADYFSVTIPSSWSGNYIYDSGPRPNGGYYLAFYEEQDYYGETGGFLCGIDLIPLDEYDDGVDWYEYYATLTTPEEMFTIGISYPSDVQWSDGMLDIYTQMTDDIPQLLDTIVPADGCEISFG